MIRECFKGVFGSYCNGSGAWLCNVSCFLVTGTASNLRVESCAIICLCPYLKPLCMMLLCSLHLPCTSWHTAGVLLNGADSWSGRGWRLEIAAVQGNPSAKLSSGKFAIKSRSKSSLLVGKHNSTEVRNLVLLCLHKLTFMFL